MQPLAITSGTCITPHRRIDDGLVVTRDGTIDYVGPHTEARMPDHARVIDATGQFVCPGFIDLQVNGGKGSSVVDATAEAFRTVTRFHTEHGTTALAPTLVSSSMDRMFDVLELIREFQSRSQPNTAKVLGGHLEGPYLSKERRGAHHPDRINEKAEKRDWQQLLEYADAISLVTAAPEVPGVLEFARALRGADIAVSMGHTNATCSEAARAVEAGFSLVTHLYCDTSTITRRDLIRTPGVLEAAWLIDSLAVSVIGDDVHVPAILLEMIAKQKGVDKTILISDATRPAGMPDGEYVLGDPTDDNRILVDNGVAQTLDRSGLAGSMVAMDTCLQTAAIKADLTVQEAVTMATLSPARLLGVDDRMGSLSVGKDADIVIVDADFSVQYTIVNGRIAYDRVEDARPSMDVNNVHDA